MTRIKSDWVRPDFSTNYQENFKNFGLLVLRLGVASMMLFGHGFNKMVNFSEIVINFPDPIGFGAATALMLTILAEVICSIAIAFGLATRLATIPLIITMLMAALVIHGDDPWSKKELGMIYLMP